MNQASLINLFKFACLFLALSSLTQCTSFDSLPPPPEVVAESQRAAVWQKNQTTLNQLRTQKNWTMLARVGLASKQGSTSSQLDWVNSTNNYTITLNNMLTYGVIVINSNNKKVDLTYQDQVYTAKNPEELLFKLTALKLPVSQLEYWFLGLPTPNLPVSKQELNQYALLSEINQGAFKIIYDNYSYVHKYQLPHKITIKSPSVYIKINVQSWNLKSN